MTIPPTPMEAAAIAAVVMMAGWSTPASAPAPRSINPAFCTAYRDWQALMKDGWKERRDYTVPSVEENCP